MFHKISIDSLYSFYNISNFTGISATGDNNICIDNTKYTLDEDKETLKALDKEIDIIFLLEKSFIDPGYYTNDIESYSLDLNYNDSYFLTGETISRLDEVTTYNGSLIEGLNFNNNSLFTGILEKNDEYIHYVFNAYLEDGLIVENSGIEYFTFLNDDFSFFKYYPKKINETNNIFSYKDENTYFEYNQLRQQQFPFIDRGDFLEPNYSHEALAEINTLEDLDFSIFNINKNQ